ncbi:sorting nexin lst-4 [Melanaphis sacchari]|uniref:Sorting nexin-33 n=1 Tax=Melanaphis sacchari TaxID=742174 RepID=A0A2H8TIF9_9HEMI|nr:sorting nexin lst-4 [Melanaphis sacchari]
MKVLVLYDFVGEPGSSELSVTAGETLLVSRKDVGEGWWEGTNTSGRTGLFPAAYVEEIKTKVDDRKDESKPPPALPPPPLPPSTDPWELDDQQNEFYSQVPGSYNQQQNTYQQSPDDFYDDEWDDDSEYGGGSTVTSSAPIPPTIQYPAIGTKTTSIRKTTGKTVATTGGSSSRFSKLVGGGDASYIMGAIQPPIHLPDTENITIVVRGGTGGGPMAVDVEWCRDPDNEPHGYQCLVASPKKESKLKGLKSFIAYQLTPTFNNIQVSRRYKHFDWLHERLLEKYCCLVPIPPLPDKQISGRYEEQFIERRKQQLQVFVDAVCRHPVLSRSWVWRHHFITCTDEKRWKSGKRKAESRNTSAETLTGANVFFVIRVVPADGSSDPPPAINPAILDREVDGFQRFVTGLEGALKNMAQTIAEQSKRMQTCYKRDAQRLGQSFYMLGHAYSGASSSSIGDTSGNGNVISLTTRQLMTALKKTGDVYNEMGGRLMDELPVAGWDSFADMLHVYRGVAGAFPDILAVHKSAVQKRKECERQYSEGLPIGGGGGDGTGGSSSGASLSGSGSGGAVAVADPEQQRRLLREMQRRTDVVSYALLAEINQFHRDHVLGQMAGHVRQLLRNQIEYYRKIADNLENVLHMYPDNGDEDSLGVGMDHHYDQQQYSQVITDDNAPYQHQYYSNQ